MNLPTLVITFLRTITSHEDLKVCAKAGRMEALTDNRNLTFQKLWLYPANAKTSGGKLVANTGAVYVGKGSGAGAPMVTPDTLAVGDLPIKYELPAGFQMRVADVFVQTDIDGDGVYFCYWP